MPTQTPIRTTSTITPTSTPAGEPSPASIESQPDGKAGPWLIFACSEDIPRASPAFTDADGANCTRFDLPALPGADRAWEIFPAPRGGYVAFRVSIRGDNDTYNPALNGVDNFLWIIKLPENRIVRTIPLIDEASWEMAHQDRSGKHQDIAPPMAVMYDQNTYRWSPDGRYLAFSASAGSSDGLDLLLYDTLSDQIKRLTDGKFVPAAHAWSPDGNWIIYEDIEECYLDMRRCRLDSDGNLYAISLQDVERKITQEDGSPLWEIEWMSGHSLLFANFVGMNPAFHLYSMDLESGEFRSLYNENFAMMLYVPPTGAILFFPGKGNPLPAGLYQIDPPSGTAKPYPLNGYEKWRIFWQDEMQLILGDRTDPVSQENQIVGLTPDGQVMFTVQNTYGINPSSDGQWFVATIGRAQEILYDANGQIAAQLFEGRFASLSTHKILWREDSSAFYAGIEACQPGFTCLVRYDQNNAWASIPIGQYKTDQGAGYRPGVYLIEP